jgi:hypothetical protein
MTGQEGQTTVRISVTRGRMNAGIAYGILKKYWDPRISEQIRGIKNFKNGMGVVFDMRSE